MLKPISLPTKYRLLKELDILLGFFVYLGLGGGLYSLGNSELLNGILSFGVMAVCYYSSSKLSYKVLELMIRLESRGSTPSPQTSLGQAKAR